MSLRDYFEGRAREGSWGALYDGPPGLGSYNFLTRRETALRLLERQGALARVFDVGCGTGDYFPVAQRHGAAYHGLDFAPEMVRAARERTRAAGWPGHFVVGAGERLPYRTGVFDLVLAQGYIAYFADPRPALDELRRVLRPGGLLVMQCAKPDLLGRLDRALFDPLISLLRYRHLPRPKPPPPGWVNVQYSERKLDALARAAGFERIDRGFCNFNTLPGLLRRRFPGAWIRSSELLTRRARVLASFLAVNYTGLYRLPEPAGR